MLIKGCISKVIMITFLIILSFSLNSASNASIEYKKLPSWVPYWIRGGHSYLHLGGYWSSPGESQNIGIRSLIGNHYTVESGSPGNVLFGLGYMVKGLDRDRYQFFYGMNGYYLAPILVKGIIVQEYEFTNLAYHYKVQNIPIYFSSKGVFNTPVAQFTIDAGVGPNFIRLYHYNERPLNSYTLVDEAFSSHTRVTVAAMLGIGVQLNNIFARFPVECGYRLFYLGRGQASINNSELLNSLKTAEMFSNVIACSAIF